MKISSVFWIKRNCQGLHEPLNKPIASLQAFYEKTTPQCPWNLPCVEQLCPTSDEARFRQPGVNPTKQLDFGCCFFEEILEIDFSEKKKTSTVYVLKKKLLYHRSSWKLPLFPINNTSIYPNGFTPPASGCLRTMPLNWRSASALGNVKQPVWEFPRNPWGSQLPVEPWEKGPLVVAGLYRAWLKLPSYVGYDNNPCIHSLKHLQFTASLPLKIRHRIPKRKCRHQTRPSHFY